MFIMIAIGGVVLIGAVIGWAASPPDPFRVARAAAMAGSHLCFGKVLGLFFNMDKMIGKDFETGLANLKAITERE